VRQSIGGKKGVVEPSYLSHGSQEAERRKISAPGPRDSPQSYNSRDPLPTRSRLVQFYHLPRIFKL
jgi:hypothetical protein